MRLTRFECWTIVTALNLAGSGIWLVAPVRAQGEVSGDWSSHNYDARNSRFSPLDQINTSNVIRLTQRWTIEMEGADVISQMTPIVVDGVMYFNAGSKVFAVDGATGKSIWTYRVEPPFPGGVGRGPTYADGRIYAFGDQVMYAIDAKTGQIVQSFGNNRNATVPS